VEKALGARAARTIAYAPRHHQHGSTLTDAVEPPQSGHEMDRMLALARPLGIDLSAMDLLPRFALPRQSHTFAEGWLRQRGLQPGGYVVLGLGARKRVRQPSTEQVLGWSARWRENRGLQTVFMWTPGKGSPLYPGDDDVADPVLAAGRTDIHPFRGPIVEALGLIWGAAASVFPDSGLMHFAAASPGGVIGLFAAASTSPEQWAPRGSRARWVLADTVPALTDETLFGPLDALLDANSLAGVRAPEAAASAA
jgi:ADP-heptose:LPS heptosyltransferase